MGRITDLNFLNKIMLKAIWTPHHVTQVDIFLRKAGMLECRNARMSEIESRNTKTWKRCSQLKCSKLAAVFFQTLSNLFTRCSRVLWQYFVWRRSVSSALIKVLLLFTVVCIRFCMANELNGQGLPVRHTEPYKN